LIGPTAVGKTEMALRLAEQLDLEIVSCDSRQVYRYMDIGTAKPTRAERERVRHWLVDVIEPDTKFSAYDFASRATKVIGELHRQGRQALICGGTGLYFKCLKDGMGPQTAADTAFRHEMKQKVARDGNQSIFTVLERLDPDSASRVHPNDTRRVIRALEVLHTTGIPLSRHQQRTRGPDEFAFCTIVVHLPRSQLYARIDARVERMIETGLWEEFQSLRNQGYDRDSPGMQCIGYRELFAVEQGSMRLVDAVELIKRNSRRYAKRQMAWFTNKVTGQLVDTSVVPVRGILHTFRTFLTS
jgi:tRNA dimethylallyltransferase